MSLLWRPFRWEALPPLPTSEEEALGQFLGLDVTLPDEPWEFALVELEDFHFRDEAVAAAMRAWSRDHEIDEAIGLEVAV